VVLPFRKGHLTFNQVEIYVAVVAGLVTMAVLWLRWRKEEEGELQEEPKVEPVQPPETIEAEP
jgi:hypothetical protein